MVVPYLALIANILILVSESGFTATAVTLNMLVSGLSLLISFSLAIVGAILMVVLGFPSAQMARWGLTVKLANLPIQMLLGALFALMALCFFVFLMPLLIILALYLYLLMLPSSILCFAAAIKARTERGVEGTPFALSVIGLWIPVCDIAVAAALCSIVWERSARQGLVEEMRSESAEPVN